jgi:hypothetical protein
MQNKFPLSYSRLSCFKQCPAKFEYLYITKSVQDAGNEHTRFGERVHKSLQSYGETADPAELTNETVDFKRILDKVLGYSGKHYYEHKMAIDEDCMPVDWFSSDAWFRGIADVLIVDGDRATCIDWKTGKKREDMTQLMLFSCMVMFTFPQINTVQSAFVWLKSEETTTCTVDREAAEKFWVRMQSQFDKVQEAVDVGVFTAKTSALCNWCPANKVCIYR